MAITLNQLGASIADAASVGPDVPTPVGSVDAFIKYHQEMIDTYQWFQSHLKLDPPKSDLVLRIIDLGLNAAHRNYVDYMKKVEQEKYDDRMRMDMLRSQYATQSGLGNSIKAPRNPFSP